MKRLLLLTFLILAACTTPATPATPESVTATATATEPPTITPRPTDAATRTPHPTATPSPTPTQEPDPQPTATATPFPTPSVVIRDIPAELPDGFSIQKFASLYRPTSLTFDRQGVLLATSADGTVHAFPDADADGYADSDITVSWGFQTPLGITVHPDTGDIWLSVTGRIAILRDKDGDYIADEVVRFMGGLPYDRHQNNNLKFGPDGWLYMGVGSTCDVCVEADGRSATIMRFDPNTAEAEVYAAGLRNPYDLAFHPLTGALFATDNGRDDLGEDEPQEELNHIVAGGDYGFPDCWDEGKGPNCAGTLSAIAFFEARSSANSIDFYTAQQFPPQYWNQPFVAVFGSFVKPGVKTGIQFVPLTASGDSYTAAPVWFASWQGMPLGLIMAPDGTLYVGDYINDAVYRLSYGP